MAIYIWDSTLEVGIKSIDEQHRKFIGYINGFLEAALEQKVNEKAASLLAQLQEYSDLHFKTEESNFDLFGFADGERHKAEHNWFKEQLRELEDMWRQGNPDFSSRAIMLLKTWFTNHIKETDRKYVPFFKQKGIT